MILRPRGEVVTAFVFDDSVGATSSHKIEPKQKSVHGSLLTGEATSFFRFIGSGFDLFLFFSCFVIYLLFSFIFWLVYIFLLSLHVTRYVVSVFVYASDTTTIRNKDGGHRVTGL